MKYLCEGERVAFCCADRRELSACFVWGLCRHLLRRAKRRNHQLCFRFLEGKMLNTNSSTASRKHRGLLLSFLLYSVCIYASRGDRGALCEHLPPPPCEHRGRYSSRHAGFPEITPILKTQLRLQSNSPLIHAPPLHLPKGQTHHGWGLWESSPYAEGEARAGFARMRFVPQPSAEHVQAERLEMFIKRLILAGKRSESRSPAKSQQHGGARAAPAGYLAVSRQAKRLFPHFQRTGGASPTSATCHSHIRAQTHTQGSTATEICALLSEEMGLSWFAAVWEGLHFRSTHHNNRKPHDDWNSFL